MRAAKANSLFSGAPTSRHPIAMQARRRTFVFTPTNLPTWVPTQLSPVLALVRISAQLCGKKLRVNISFNHINVGVGRTFRLREVVPSDEKDDRSARTYNIPLRHNSVGLCALVPMRVMSNDTSQLVIMHASTQEMFKHAVPPQSSIDMFHPPFPPPPSLTDDKTRLAQLQGASNARINVTFRFFRPDFLSRTIPRCDCGIPCILRPDMKNRLEASTAGPSKSVSSNVLKDTSRKQDPPGPPTKRTHSEKEAVARYWWACAVGGRNDGKGCRYWKVMDVKAEGRGPFASDVH